MGRTNDGRLRLQEEQNKQKKQNNHCRRRVIAFLGRAKKKNKKTRITIVMMMIIYPVSVGVLCTQLSSLSSHPVEFICWIFSVIFYTEMDKKELRHKLVPISK